MSKYYKESLVISAAALISDRKPEIWNKEVASDVRHAYSVPQYDELLYDAENFRSNQRNDVATLFAAIAAELVLEKACANLLTSRGELTEDQINTTLTDIKISSLLHMIQSQKPSLKLNRKGVDELFRLRNKVAHGKVTSVSSIEAIEALSVSNELKKNLTTVLDR